jgi:CDP-diacylglycerol--serine O-phosphatidyltransferase
MRRPRLPRASMVMLPNGLTLLNLFFGIFAIVAASRGDHERAVWYILIGAMCDAMDGRIARATHTGSKFGEELDSLVDAISFGLAPALLMYFAVLRQQGWDWIFVFLFSACAVMRLARFNVEQAGRAKTYFRGLPSPMAGGVLATYFWFSQTTLYNQTIISDLPWHTMVRYMMAGLSFLMISNVPYHAWPTFSMKSWRGTVGLLIFVGLAIGLFLLPKEFFFPVGMAYVISGVVAAVVNGLLDRPRPLDDDLEALDDTTDAGDAFSDGDSRSGEGHRRHRRRRRGARGALPHIDRHAPEEPPT